MPLPHLLPVTDPAAWCFICRDPHKECPTPVDCGLQPPPRTDLFDPPTSED